MNFVFRMTCLGGLGLLALAIWPGVLDDALLSVPYILITLPIIGLWAILLIWLSLRELFDNAFSPNRKSWIATRSMLVMFATLAMLLTHVPQRIVFIFFVHQLQPFLIAAPEEKYQGARGRELGIWVGPYWIDRFDFDRRGGVFFRTHVGPDGIGPDQMSYGFAFQPNKQGTPFGNAHCLRQRLFGEWFAFEASDDW